MCQSHVQVSNGLFKEEWALTGANAGTATGSTLTNGAGIGLLCNLEFYRATGNVAYLREAQRIAQQSRSSYFNSSTGAINDEGFWDFELVDGLDDLYLVDHNPVWVNANVGAMNWLHGNREDPNGHYGTLWGRETYTLGTVRASWNMIDQAAVAESYLHTAVAKAAASPFVTAAGDAVSGFYLGAVGLGDTPSTMGAGSGQYLSNEGPGNSIDRDGATKYLNFGNGNSGVSSATKGLGTGFIVTPAIGPSIVTAIQVATANDSPNRDPLTVSIEGTNSRTNFDTGSVWTLIADNVNLGISSDPGRQMFGPEVSFANSTAYRSYRIIVKSQRGSDNGVQYSEMNLIGVRDTVPPTVVDGSFDISGPAVTVRFSEDVSESIIADDLVVTNKTTGQVISGGINVSWDRATLSARFGFPGFPNGLPDGNYQAVVLAAGVSDLAHNAMASSYTVNFFVLAGDANGDHRVDFSDLVVVAQHYGTLGGMTYAGGDFNYDGKVDFADLVTVAQRYGTGVAGPAVGAALAVSPTPVVVPVFSTSRVTPVGKPRRLPGIRMLRRS